jgi:hypothetical protein
MVRKGSSLAADFKGLSRRELFENSIVAFILKKDEKIPIKLMTSQNNNKKDDDCCALL